MRSPPPSPSSSTESSVKKKAAPSPVLRPCAAYVRVSHAKQTRSYHERRGRGAVAESELEGGVSYEAQQEALGRWVAEHRLTIAAGHMVAEIESAKDPGDWTVSGGNLSLKFVRGSFGELIEKLRAPKSSVKILVVQDWDRLARNELEFFLVRDLIVKSGVEVHSFRDGLVVNAANFKQHALALRVKNMIASEESSTRTARIRDAIRYKAETLKLFVGNIPPVGYRWRPLDGSRKATRTLVVDEPEAKLVLQLYARAATGEHNLVALHQWAIKVGLFPPNSPKSRVKDTLTNPIYCTGLRWTPHGGTEQIVLAGNNPRIVEDAVFLRVQEVLRGLGRTKRKRTERFYTLTASLECAECGARLSPSRPEKIGRVYWTCRNGTCGALPGPGKFVREEDVVEQVAEYLDSISLTRAQAEHYVEMVRARAVDFRPGASKVAALEQQLRDAQRAVERSRRNVLDDELDDETRAMARARLREAVERVKQSEIELSSLRPTAEVANSNEDVAAKVLTSAVSMGRAWLKLDDVHRRLFLGKVLRPPTGTDRRLPVTYDWRARKIVEVRLRPAWALVAKLAAERVCVSGGPSVDTKKLLGELVRVLAAA